MVLVIYQASSGLQFLKTTINVAPFEHMDFSGRCLSVYSLKQKIQPQHENLWMTWILEHFVSNSWKKNIVFYSTKKVDVTSYFCNSSITLKRHKKTSFMVKNIA